MNCCIGSFCLLRYRLIHWYFTYFHDQKDKVAISWTLTLAYCCLLLTHLYLCINNKNYYRTFNWFPFEGLLSTSVHKDHIQTVIRHTDIQACFTLTLIYPWSDISDQKRAIFQSFTKNLILGLQNKWISCWNRHFLKFQSFIICKLHIQMDKLRTTRS